ncbi:MAG: hypothetical protein ACYC96_00275 [Fimbriimonadaceae bacterium]
MVRQVDGWWYQAGPADADTTDFDIQFWQAQGPSAIFAAAWEMVETAHKMKGRHPDELRLQRPDFVLKQIPR